MSDTPKVPAIEKDESQVNPQEPQSDKTEKAEPVSEYITKEQVQEMLNKVRSEEKSKLRKSLEKTKEENESLTLKNQKVEEELNSTREQLEAIKDSSLTEYEKVNKQIDLLIAQNASLTEKLQTVAKDAENKVKMSEARAYREKRIKEAGLLSADMVVGSTPEEIDNSIEIQLQKENALKERLEDKIREELAVNVPKPVSPNNQEPSIAPQKDRWNLSKLKPDEYKSLRQKMLAQALDSIRS